MDAFLPTIAMLFNGGNVAAEGFLLEWLSWGRSRNCDRQTDRSAPSVTVCSCSKREQQGMPVSDDTVELPKCAGWMERGSSL